MKKGVIYARYSSDRQNEQSIQGQVDVCTEWAKNNDISIVNMYHDDALTGKTDHRPAFQQMIKDAKTEKFDYIIGMDDANVRNIERICGGDPEHKITKLLEHAGADRSIADPWYTGDFDATYEDVLEGCVGFLAYLKEQGQI